MFVPYSSDAPLYYFPWGTIGIMAANVLLFFVESSFLVSGWSNLLLDPVKMLSLCFLHFDYVHLIGNMVGLWTFALCVEGRLGFWRFLAVYFGIAVVAGLVRHVSGLAEVVGESFGASGQVYALMAMAFVFAPESRIRTFIWVFPYMHTVETRIRTIAILFVVWQVTVAIFFTLAGHNVGGEALQLFGVVIGFPLAAVLVKKGYVNCEGWDLFSIRKEHPNVRALKQEFATRKELQKTVAAAATGVRPATPEDSQPLLEWALADGDLGRAEEIYRDGGSWPLPESLERNWISLAAKADVLDRTKPLLLDYVRRFPSDAAPVQLLLARVYVESERRPTQALTVLLNIDLDQLNPAERTTYDKLIEQANSLRSSGALELDIGD